VARQSAGAARPGIALSAPEKSPYDTLKVQCFPSDSVCDFVPRGTAVTGLCECRAGCCESKFPVTLSLDDVARIAHLARIEITAAEATEVHAKLEAIFAMINELAAIDTSGVIPMAHAQDVSLPLREDGVTDTDQHRLYQSVAPAVEDDLYLVPKVIE